MIQAGSSTFTIPLFYKNGSNYIQGNELESGAGSVASGGMAMIQLAATDYVEVWTDQNSTTVNGTASPPVYATWFQGWLLSTT